MFVPALPLARALPLSPATSPGAMAYGATRDEAIARVEALGLRVLADL